LASLVEDARGSRDWIRLALLQARRFAIAAGAERAAIALEIAEVEHRELQNPSAARAWICRAIETAPQLAALYEQLAALAREGGAAQLRESLERVIQAHADRIPITALLVAASLQREGGASERALAHLERANERDPDSLAAVDALIEVLSAL